jgi:type II restriction enzyme
MKRNFNDWLLTFKDSIADWNYYTDFNKVYKNVDSIKIELNLLNSLINSRDIENEFLRLVTKYPEVLRAVPILLAKRESEIKISKPEGTKTFKFSKANYSITEYAEFMRNTGLFELLSRHIISDLSDYVKGVEVGLDSNARKNRTGTAMENLVESHLVRLGFFEGKSYFRQLRASQIYKLFGVDVTNVDIENKAEKVFDFVVKTENLVYGIEVNFYSGGGSKLNETARSFKMIAQESKGISGFKFVWITDGTGWFSAKNNLEETFSAHDYIFNINDLETGKLEEILK